MDVSGTIGLNSDQLVVERNRHLCRNKKFVEKFISMYINCNDELINCQLINQNLTSKYSPESRLREFERYVMKCKETAPLSTLIESFQEKSKFSMRIMEVTETEIVEMQGQNDTNKGLDTSNILD